MKCVTLARRTNSRKPQEHLPESANDCRTGEKSIALGHFFSGNGKIWRMAKDSFDFKQFTIRQGSSAMGVGTDSVLLGAVAHFPESGNILDIGAGTGLLSIMAAQKSPKAMITGVEINAGAFNDALANAKASPWGERINMVHADIMEFNPALKFDFVISNPPYYENLEKSGNSAKDMARHDETLNYAGLAASIDRLMDTDGACMLIIPNDFEDKLMREAVNCKLCLARRIPVITKEGKQPKRVILELRRKVRAILSETIIIKDSVGNYTRQYKELTKDFYLNLN